MIIPLNCGAAAESFQFLIILNEKNQTYITLKDFDKYDITIRNFSSTTENKKRLKKVKKKKLDIKE